MIAAERLYTALAALDETDLDVVRDEISGVLQELEWRRPAGLNEAQEQQARFDALGLSLTPATRGSSPLYQERVAQLRRMHLQGWSIA